MRNYLLLMTIFCLFLSESCQKASTEPTPAPAPVASFKYAANGYVVGFTSTSTNSPSTLTWDFGDGSATMTGQTVNHTYATSGTYSVQLTAATGSMTNIAKMDVIVKEQVIQIHTSFGDMFLWLYNETPAYKANFIKNVTTHLYDSTTFHRVVPNFVIQGGDSLSKGADQSLAGTGGPDNLPLDIVSGITHIYGAVGAASHAAKGPGNNWQFYIVTNTGGDHTLDGNYSVFGYIMKGMNVANTIQNQKADGNSKPLVPIRMSTTILNLTKAEILANYGYTVK